jgi:hypothetical protein
LEKDARELMISLEQGPRETEEGRRQWGMMGIGYHLSHELKASFATLWYTI